MKDKGGPSAKERSEIFQNRALERTKRKIVN